MSLFLQSMDLQVLMVTNILTTRLHVSAYKDHNHLTCYSSSVSFQCIVPETTVRR
jgi:hypothetical protein